MIAVVCDMMVVVVKLVVELSDCSFFIYNGCCLFVVHLFRYV